MAPKKIVKRIKRSLPPRNKDGFDPRLVALGAIGGAAAGAARGRAAGRRSALNDISMSGRYPTTDDIRRSKDVPSGEDNWGSTRYKQVPDKFGTGVMSAGYRTRLGRNSQASEWLSENMATEGKKEYKSDRKVSKFVARTIGKATVSARGKQGAKRGAVKGAIGGAALAALVQLVAKELNKK